MGTDKISKLVLTFDGEAGTIDSVLSSIKGSVRAAVTDLERTTSKVELFGQLQDNLPKIQSAIDRNTAAAAKFREEIANLNAAGAVPLKVVTDGLAAAEKAAAKARTEFAKQASELSSLGSSLKATGVDTNNLAAAETKLAAATRDAAAAAELQTAKQALGVKTLADVQPQIAKLNAAYETLRASGKLSGTELAAAQQALASKIKETNAQVSVATTGFGQLRTSAESFLTSTLGRFLSVAAAVTAVTHAISESVAASRAYEQGIAEIGTVTNLTKTELDELGRGVRRVSEAMGIDLQAALKATFELIRSGVAPGNALEVLAVSAEAAQAGLTDVGVTAKISQILIDGYGHSVGDLRTDFDALVRGSKDGGATLKEFAESGAPLANVARAANVEFKELVAILAVMTDASNDAAGSQAALTKIILRIGDADVRARLRAFGIETTNVLEIFKQLGQQGRSVDNIIDLGLASTKTAAGVAALTNASSKLPAELEAINESAGLTKKISDDLFDSPTRRAARFNAALEETKTKLGELLGSGSAFATAGTGLLTAFNKTTIGAGDLDTQIAATTAGVALFATEVSDTEGNLDQADRALQRVATSAAEAARVTATANKTLAESGKTLTEGIAALNAAAVRDIADLNALAERQIAALDRGVNAQAATAAKSIAIQTKTAAARLAIIQKTEADITAAVEAQAIAQNKTSQETAQLRLAALAPVLAQYQAHYNALVAQAQSYKAKIDSIEQQRIDFNRGITQTLLDISNASQSSALSAFDLYSQKIRRIDQLIADAREAGINQNIAKAKQYTDEAIALSGTLREVQRKDGTVIVSSLEAQTTATTKIKAAAAELNTAFDGASDAAKEGLEETRKGLAATIPLVDSLTTKYDALKASIAEGLEIRIRFDERAIADAKTRIDDLVRARVIDVSLDTTGSTIPTGGGLAGGGFVRAFAGGGNVYPFRAPSWSKVPGTGSADTVPAALRPGSFVVRQAASDYYGDGALGRIARGYAGGGPVQQFTNPVTGSVITAFGASPAASQKIIDYGGLIPSLAPTSYEKFFAGNKSAAGDYFGNIDSGSTQSVRDVGQIAPPKLPDDKNALIRLVLQYANEVVVAANPEKYIFQRAIDELNAELRQYDRTQNLDVLMQALQTARAIGLNLGISNGDLHGFDVDGRRWHRETAFGSFGALGLSPGAGSYSFFARGGDVGGDTIPAWLTPREWVIQPAAVDHAERMFGGGFMHALNNMTLPRGYLDNIVNFPAPRPQTGRAAHFAEGGLVGGIGYAAPRSGPSTGARGAGGGIVINLTVNTTTLDDRAIDSLITQLNRRVRKSA